MPHRRAPSWLLRLITGNGILSPFSNTMWISIVCASSWLVATLTARNAFSTAPSTPVGVGYIVWAWIQYVLILAFYTYKFLENLYVAIWPELWWSLRILSDKRKRHIAKSAEATAVRYLDALDLFLAYPFVQSLLIHALVETDPTVFTALDADSLSWNRLGRYLALSTFLQNGIGFSALLSSVVYVDLSAAFISFYGTLINWSLLGVIAGSIAKSSDKFRELLLGE